jgi:hypothetical protein
MPHGPLERLDDNLWAVESDVPGIPGLERRMSIVRRADGGLLFYNAVPVRDAVLGEIRALGAPAQLGHELLIGVALADPRLEVRELPGVDVAQRATMCALLHAN